jgi:hypothetical protein
VRSRAVHIAAIGLLALSGCAHKPPDSNPVVTAEATGTILIVRPVRLVADLPGLGASGILVPFGERPETAEGGQMASN